MTTPAAHMTPGGGLRAHLLEAHLRDTSALAGTFAERFGSADWAALAGLWHDLGKYRPAFQRYLASVVGIEPDAPAGRVDHSTAGAIHAIERLGDIGRVVAYSIAGHHAGLPDWQSPESGSGALAHRLSQRALLEDALSGGDVPPSILGAPTPSSFPPTRGTPSEAEGLHVWVRMMYSCLVDADFLDTERFFDSGKSTRRASWPGLGTLRDRLAAHQAALPVRGPVDAVRRRVLAEAVAQAGLEPGFFSLTVPTGGGKTLTSLRFALEHALQHGLGRVVYAIPYLSIIEQAADAFRAAVGAEAVLEHHSSLDPDERDERARLAAENWDAPLVVTTAVQLFESLFASRGSRCRKLHNLAGAVVVLDEAQLLPPGLLAPILSALRSLVAGYGASVVLCTATQPALASRTAFGAHFRGLDGVRELVADPEALFGELERVRVEWPASLAERVPWPDVAERLRAQRQVLCVVNRRADARTLIAAMGDEEAVHLSALMCAEHRSAVLARIRDLLTRGEPVRVVSTQLVEAGVDVDFPVVYRALAGLDSIAQAAGRCNREGHLAGLGRVVVFVPPELPPVGHLRRGEQATRSILATVDAQTRMTPSTFRRYFELLYAAGPLDENGVLPLLVDGARHLEFAFRTAAERFQMVDEAGTATVVVPYGRGADLMAELVAGAAGPIETDRQLLRRLQRYTISVHQRHLDALRRAGAVEEARFGVWALTAPEWYDERLGLLTERAIPDLVV